MAFEISRHYDAVFINGEWLKPQNAERVDIINPATEKAMGSVFESGIAECELAIAAASATFTDGSWSFREVRERVDILERFIDLIEQNASQIIPLMIDETGTTAITARMLFFRSSIEICRHYLALARNTQTYMTPLEMSDQLMGGTALSTGAVAHEPVGVVACITPFNAPLFLNLGKIIPAMVMGNTVLLKPSPLTPIQALFLGDIAQLAGLPSGVLNIVTGPISVSEMLTTDPRIDLVSFTGSDLVGSSIMAQAAPTLKRVVLELGGKSANIVCADANINDAAMYAIGSTSNLAGQGCALCTRHIVHNSLYKPFVARVKQLSWAFSCGNPHLTASMVGPLISASQRERVERYVQMGVDAGGRLLCGGKRPNYLKQGYFYEPTMFLDLDNNSQMVREEIFGPVGVIIGFDTEEEAIAMANDSEYGLAGNVFSQDVGNAYHIARRIRTGGVSINGGSGTAQAKQPFGGIKRSGFGRENGIDGLMEYTYKKTISFRAA